MKSFSPFSYILAAVVGGLLAAAVQAKGETSSEFALKRISNAFQTLNESELNRKKYGRQAVSAYEFAPRAKPFQKRSDPSKCSKQDFRAKLGEVRNQGGLGWCFSFVAADFLSFYSGQSISPFELGLRYYEDPQMRSKRLRIGADKENIKSINDVSGGVLNEVVDTALKNGVCRDEDFSSADFIASTLVELWKRSGKEMPDITQDQIEAVAFSGAAGGVQQALGTSLKGMTEDTESSCFTVLNGKFLFPKATTLEILSAISATENSWDAFLWLANRTCTRSALKLPKGFSFVSQSTQRVDLSKSIGADFLPTVDSQISAGRPVVITYDLHPFMKEGTVRQERAGVIHTSILVGREFRDGECKYLVRNSLGASCAGYRDRYSENCQRGHFWISESDFHRTVKEVSYAP